MFTTAGVNSMTITIKNCSTQAQAAWVPCIDCDEYFCTIHEMHAHECDCPPVDEWPAGSSPYEPINKGIEMNESATPATKALANYLAYIHITGSRPKYAHTSTRLAALDYLDNVYMAWLTSAGLAIAEKTPMYKAAQTLKAFGFAVDDFQGKRKSVNQIRLTGADGQAAFINSTGNAYIQHNLAISVSRGKVKLHGDWHE